jgi:hypothetical protein
MVSVMSLTRLWLLAVVNVALLAGCGQVVVFGHVVGEGKAPEVAQTAAPTETKDSQAVVATTVPAFKSITLKVAPNATDNVASSTPFEPELLLEALRTELRARKLLDEENPQLASTAEVQVSEVSVRPSTNAVVFGYQMMSGTLIGDVHLAGAALHVLADTRLTIPVDDENRKKDPLGPLYRRFALLTADRIQGVESKPDPSTVGGQPRY